MKSLYSKEGERLYCTAEETDSFLKQADKLPSEAQLFCYVLALTGCRISEALALRKDRICTNPSHLVFETLKRRERGVFRAVPVPFWFSSVLKQHFESLSDHDCLWQFGRTAAYLQVKQCFERAGMIGANSSPKALRHSFAINALTCGVPLNMLQKWLGHSKIETTAIYANATGEEEQKIAKRMWNGARKPRR